jgi:hypothetical protein
MTTWVLNTVGLFAVTVGTLILFLHLHRTSLAAGTCMTPSRPCVRNEKLIKWTLGLMSGWFIVQYLAVILI